MAEVLIRFDPPLTDNGGRSYGVRVCGRIAGDGLWEGWIEFDPAEGGVVLRTPRETEQSSRSDLESWGTGLTVAYMEGALARALRAHVPAAEPPIEPEPAYDQPASPAVPSPLSPAVGWGDRSIAILNPFNVYRQGEGVLRDELSALDEGHLRKLVRAHDLVKEEEMDLLALQRASLAEIIVAAVGRRLT